MIADDPLVCGSDTAETSQALLLAAEESGLPHNRAEAMVQDAIARLAGVKYPMEAPPAPADVGKTEIRVEPGNLTEQINAAEAALLRGELGLYQRAGALVRIGWAAAGGTEIMRIVPVEEPHLIELIGRVTRWLKRDARSRGYVQCPPPRDVAAAYMARGGLEWRLPRLVAVIEVPTLRQDGTLLAQPGYDPETGLYFAPGDCHAFPPWLSKSAASRAGDDISDLLEGFPFVGEADHSVAVAAILTAVIRRALPTAPMFAMTAPAPGTGKSMLGDVVAMIATGHPAKSLTWTGDPAEDRKALDAALLESAAVVSLDNCTAPLGGDRLNQMLTQGAATVRVLGQSKTVEVVCGALVLSNGNNLAIAADLTRRTMLCRLDAKAERPELRDFASNPLDMIRADRGRYVEAALTILMAYHVAGRPAQPKPLGSFEAWSGWVRGAIMWLGLADPAATQEAARETDPRGSELAAVLGQWDETISDRHVTSAQVISAATGNGAGELRESLLSVAGRAGAINSHRLGNWLHANKGRVVGGLRLEQAGKTRNGAALWTLNGARAASEIVRFPGCEFSEAAD